MGEQDIQRTADGGGLREFTGKLLTDLRALEQMLRDGMADLYLNVKMKKVGMLEFDAIEPVQQLGYEQGLDALRKWIDGGGLKP